MTWSTLQAVARGHGATEGVRPAHHGRRAARVPRRRRRSCRREYEVLTPEHDGAARLQRALGRAAQAVRDHQGAGLLVRHQGPVALPRQRLPAARRASRWRSGRFRTRSCRSRSSACRRSVREFTNRTQGPGARHRADRPRQVDDAGGDDRPDQRHPAGAHHDDRGPDRVHPSPQEVHRQPARGGRRHGLVPDRAQVRAAAGPGRHPDR